jgi:hypothetical protein
LVFNKQKNGPHLEFGKENIHNFGLLTLLLLYFTNNLKVEPDIRLYRYPAVILAGNPAKSVFDVSLTTIIHR